jgi:copper(I)-binding protein
MHRFAILAAAAAFAVPAAAQVRPTIDVVQPWSRPAVAGGTAAGFMTVTNRGKTADALVAVETTLAKRAELHRSSMTGGVMRMAPVDRVQLAPGASAIFAPGGLHVMLVGLKAPLKVGDRAPATLVFASGVRIKTAFVVSVTPPAGAATGGMGGMDHGDMGH